jgi:hypothetical protein
MRVRSLSLCLAAFVAMIFVTGCSEIELKINVNPDYSADFVEWFVLDPQLSSYLSLEQAPSEDFWARLATMAKARGWKYKQRAANQLVVSGHVEPGKLPDLEQELTYQLTQLALDYGATAATNKTAPATTRFFQVQERESLLGKIYEISYDIDLSPNALSKQLVLPAGWIKALALPRSEQLSINLFITTPTPALATNGALDQASKTVNWRLYVGQHNELEATYEVIIWWKVILLVVAAVGLIVATIFIYRRKSKIKNRI